MFWFALNISRKIAQGATTLSTKFFAAYFLSVLRVKKRYVIPYSRRKFIALTSAAATSMVLPAFAFNKKTKVSVYAHLWVYASRYPPDWDCTPILDDVFSDLKYAGLEGVELMEILLRHNDAVTRFNDLIQKYQLTVTGTSYYGNMWNKMNIKRF